MKTSLMMVDIPFTGRQAGIRAGLGVICEALGRPRNPNTDPLAHGGGDGKIEALWSVRDQYGCELVVWAYKQGPTYGKRIKDCGEWSMWGCKRLAMELFGEERVVA